VKEMGKTKEPKVWELQPGIWVLYCPYCKTREIWYLYKIGTAGEQSLQLALNYHLNKACIKK